MMMSSTTNRTPPFWNFEERENLSCDLDHAPPEDRMGNCYLGNVAPLSSAKKGAGFMMEAN
jgi:hypothetical protein